MQLADFITQRNERQAAILPPAMRGAVLAETVAQQAIEDAQATVVAAMLADEKSLRREVLQAEAAARKAFAERERAGVDFRRLTVVCGQLQLTVLQAENRLSAHLRTLWPAALPRYRVEAAIALLLQQQERIDSTRPQDVAASSGRRTSWSTAGDAAGFQASAAAVAGALDTLRGILRGDREPVKDLDQFVEAALSPAGARAAA